MSACGSNAARPPSIKQSRVSDSKGDSARPSTSAAMRTPRSLLVFGGRAARWPAGRPGWPNPRAVPRRRSPVQRRCHCYGQCPPRSGRPWSWGIRTNRFARCEVSDRRGSGSQASRHRRSPSVVNTVRATCRSTGSPCNSAALSWLTTVPGRHSAAAAMAISGLAPCGRCVVARREGARPRRGARLSTHPRRPARRTGSPRRRVVVPDRACRTKPCRVASAIAGLGSASRRSSRVCSQPAKPHRAGPTAPPPGSATRQERPPTRSGRHRRLTATRDGRQSRAAAR